MPTQTELLKSEQRKLKVSRRKTSPLIQQQRRLKGKQQTKTQQAIQQTQGQDTKKQKDDINEEIKKTIEKQKSKEDALNKLNQIFKRIFEERPGSVSSLPNSERKKIEHYSRKAGIDSEKVLNSYYRKQREIRRSRFGHFYGSPSGSNKKIDYKVENIKRNPSASGYYNLVSEGTNKAIYEANKPTKREFGSISISYPGDPSALVPDNYNKKFKSNSIDIKQETKRYQDLGYSKSDSTKLAKESVKQGGVSFSPNTTSKIIKGEKYQDVQGGVSFSPNTTSKIIKGEKYQDVQRDRGFSLTSFGIGGASIIGQGLKDVSAMKDVEKNGSSGISGSLISENLPLGSGQLSDNRDGGFFSRLFSTFKEDIKNAEETQEYYTPGLGFGTVSATAGAGIGGTLEFRQPTIKEQEKIDKAQKNIFELTTFGIGDSSLLGEGLKFKEIIKEKQSTDLPDLPFSSYLPSEVKGSGFYDTTTGEFKPAVSKEVELERQIEFKKISEKSVYEWLGEVTPEIPETTIFGVKGTTLFGTDLGNIASLSRRGEEVYEKTPSRQLEKKIPEFEKKYNRFIKEDETGQLVFVGTEEQYKQYSKDYEKIKSLYEKSKGFKTGVIELVSYGSSKLPRTYGQLAYAGAVTYGGYKLINVFGNLATKVPFVGKAVRVGIYGLDVAAVYTGGRAVLDTDLPASQRITGGISVALGVAGLGIEAYRGLSKILGYPKIETKIIGVSSTKNANKVITDVLSETRVKTSLFGRQRYLSVSRGSSLITGLSDDVYAGITLSGGVYSRLKGFKLYSGEPIFSKGKLFRGYEFSFGGGITDDVFAQFGFGGVLTKGKKIDYFADTLVGIKKGRINAVFGQTGLVKKRGLLKGGQGSYKGLIFDITDVNKVDDTGVNIIRGGGSRSSKQFYENLYSDIIKPAQAEVIEDVASTSIKTSKTISNIIGTGRTAEAILIEQQFPSYVGGTSPVSKEANINEVLLDAKVNLGQRENILLGTSPLSIQGESQDEIIKSAYSTATATDLSQESIQKSFFAQPPAVTQIESTALKTKLVQLPLQPQIPIKTPPIIPTIPFLFSPRRIGRKQKEQQGYHVYIKGRKISDVPLSREQALNWGSYVADETLEAQFKIRKTKQKPKVSKYRIPSANWILTRGKFRGYQIRKGKQIQLKDRYIEKAPYRLDTSSEVRKIKVARFLAQQGKRQSPRQRVNFNRVLGVGSAPKNRKKKTTRYRKPNFNKLLGM